MRGLSDEEEWLCKSVKQHRLALSSFQQTIVGTRSRIDWLGEGDANTSLFHSHASYHKRKNYVAKLRDGDRIVTDQKEKEEMVWNFFTNLNGMPEQRTKTLHLQPHDLQHLDAPISEEEVWKMIKELPPDKAPGPDGFTGHFYRHCWDIIKLDIMLAIGVIHGGDTRMLHQLNTVYLTLIPKKEDAITVSDYRPISLVHSFAKQVTKIMANRLAPRLHNMIANNQSAFIRGCCIHDNFILVQHMAKYIHERKESRILLKLDITKAFDTVSWAFLLEVLRHLGFGGKWCALFCGLLSSSTTRFLLNGCPGEVISHKRGLRQGDPLSPLLFIIVMDVLTALIGEADARQLLQSLASRNMGHRISIYAEDVVLFASPHAPDLVLLGHLLQKFGMATSQASTLVCH